MLSSAIIASLLLGFAKLHGGVAQPIDVEDSIIITHDTSDHFPDAIGDLSPFNVDVRYTGYDDATQEWLTSLDPASGTTDEEKARIITEAAYAKPFDANDPDMAADVDAMLATIAGNTTTIERRDGSSFRTHAAHAVIWGACSTFFACVSGTTCTFSIDVSRAPRSECQSQGGQNCCISWSSYNLKVGFFSRTWTNCDEEVKDQGQTKRSCEGYGGRAQGGDVCLSNRANGCT